MPVNYDANLLKYGAGDRDRTGTGLAAHGILSPRRLPIPPLRPSTGRDCNTRLYKGQLSGWLRRGAHEASGRTLLCGGLSLEGTAEIENNCLIGAWRETPMLTVG